MIRIDRQRVASPLNPSLVPRMQSRVRDLFALESEDRRRQKPDFPERSEIGRQASVALSELFHGKCAYCESPLDESATGEVDWFRPPFEATDLSGDGSVDHYIWLIPSGRTSSLYASPVRVRSEVSFPWKASGHNC